LNSAATETFQLVQVTDCHIEGEAGKLMLGIDTRATMKMVVDDIRLKHAPDLLVVSGDIAGEGEPQAYEFANELLDGVAPHQCWLPGNHDNTTLLKQRFGYPDFCHMVLPGWLLVGLNSSVDGEVGGYIEPAQLEQLQQLSDQNPDLALMVFMHHPPVKIGCQWIDPQHISNGTDLLTIMSKHRARSLKDSVVVTGHVHQEFDTTVMGVRVISTPSTGFQFKPGMPRFALDNKMPGYRVIQLNSDSSYSTVVHRIEDTPLDIDFSSNGYE